MKRFRAGDLQGEMVDSSTVTTANVLMLLSRGSSGGGSGSSSSDEGAGDREHTGQSPAAGRVFECKTCNRQFPSFQALGGHRASHKKPRLLQSGDINNSSRKHGKPRIHECSICGLEFAIGQALGGHMRRHRTSPTESAGFSSQVVDDQEEKIISISSKRRVLCLDLNLPPSENDGLGLGINGLSMVY